MTTSERYKKEIKTLVSSGCRVMFTRTREPYRAMDAIKELAFGENMPFNQWDFVNGWRMFQPSMSQGQGPDTKAIKDPFTAAKAIMAVDMDWNFDQAMGSGYYVMHAIQNAISNMPPFVELLRQYVRFLPVHVHPVNLIIVCHESASLPDELIHDIPTVDFDLPSIDEMKEVLDYIIESSADEEITAKDVFGKGEIEIISSSAGGLTQMEAELAFSRAIVENRKGNESVESISFDEFNKTVLDAKTEIIKQSEVLELMESVDMSDVGGLDVLKEWIENAKCAFDEEAREYGVDVPAGIAAIGPPGCLDGKTEVLYRRGRRNSGRVITLEALYRKMNGIPTKGNRGFSKDLPVYIHSYDAERAMVFYNRVIRITDSGVKPVLRIETKGGRSVSLTHDHPLLTSSGEYVQAKDLKEGDVLLVRGSMKPSKRPGGKDRRKPRVVVDSLKHYSSGWEHRVQCRKTGKSYVYRRQHRAVLVVEASLNNLTYEEYIQRLKTDPEAVNLRRVPEGWCVHHIDQNPLNDSLENLVVMQKSEHDRLHADWSALVDYVQEDEVLSVREDGNRATYDVEMESPCNNFGLANGLLVHNTGKTLVGKAIATTLGQPLVKFDVSKCFGSLVGQSEARVRSALKQLEAMGRVTVLFDEIDKSLGGSHQSSGDSGVSRRVLGAILTFMQETKAPIFPIYTANRTESLPPELLRKGRLDEVFAVLPPNRKEREAVLKIHLRKRKQNPDKIKDLHIAVDCSRGYVSAELEAGVKEAVLLSYKRKVPVTGQLIADALSQMNPLSEAFPDDFQNMLEWAQHNARLASTPCEDEQEEHAAYRKSSAPVVNSSPRVRTRRKVSR